MFGAPVLWSVLWLGCSAPPPPAEIGASAPESAALRANAPTTTRWSTPSLSQARGFLTATRISDQHLLVLGGFDGERFVATRERCDLLGGCVADRAMTTPRGWHTATALDDGSILVAGGWVGLGQPPTSGVELIGGPREPRVTSTMAAERAGHTATVLANGDVLLVGGFDSRGASRRVEIFSAQTRQFTEATSLPTARAHHAALLLPDGRVLVTGGWGQDGVPRGDSLIWDPSTGRWSDGPALFEARARHTAALLPDGRVLVVGGAAQAEVATAEIFGLGPIAAHAVITLTRERVGHTMAVLPSGMVLIAGGAVGGAAIADVEALDTTRDLVLPLAPMSVERAWAASVALDAHDALVIGGCDRQGGVLASTEIIAAPRDEKLPRGLASSDCAACARRR
jgi:hypothetical protein